MLSAEPTLAGQLRDTSPPLLLAPLVRPRLSHDASVGVDLILEGFLAHHGTPRYLRPGDRIGGGVLAGDYCYATGLVAVAGDGDLTVIRVLADLVTGRDPGHDLTRFRLARFADGSRVTPGPAL